MSLADPYGAVRDVRCAVGVVFFLPGGWVWRHMLGIYASMIPFIARE